MENNITLPKIALGTWAWGAGPVGGNEVFGLNLNEKDLKPVFDKAMELGLNLFDTAYVYGMGASENILGNLAKTTDKKVLFSTKFTPQVAGNTENPVESELQGSLERLKTDEIDIYWIHNPQNVKKWTAFLIPLFKSGKIKSIGLSNHNIDEIKQAQEILDKEGIKISAVQNHFSLLYRSSEKGGVLKYCQDNDIKFFGYMTLEQGALTGVYNSKNLMTGTSDRARMYNPILPKIDSLLGEMKNLAGKYNASVSQIAIAYVISKGIIPIVGATKEHHVADAFNSTKITLTSDEIRKLEELAEASKVDTKGGWEHSME